MQQSDAPSKIRLAWAANGTKNTIPVASQISILPGAASYNDGFPPLTMTPVIAGGIPPAGNDFNGIFNALSAINRWNNAGAGYVYDSAFAADPNVGGYPAGSRVARTDGLGYWLNTTDNNTTDPEAGGAGWVPDVAYGSFSVAMSGSNVTLTPLQASRRIIIITGTLTANLNLIFPSWAMQWQVVNNATGAFAVTAKTASGSGVAIATGTMRRVWGDGTNINDDTSAVTPTGSMMAFPTATAPIGYLKANGAAVSRTAYAALFALIGTTYGTGDGSTTFNLPNVPDGYALLAANTSAPGTSTVGSVIAHTHTINTTTQGGSGSLPSGNNLNNAGTGVITTTSSTGGSVNSAAGVMFTVCIKY